MKPIYDILTAIADRHLAIPTLLERRSDSLDFHEVSVWGVKNALWHAYQAGRNDLTARPAAVRAMHTSGDWQIEGDRDSDTQEIHIVQKSTGGKIATIYPTLGQAETDIANAFRIVVAVNACKGVSAEALEAGVLRDMRDALERAAFLMRRVHEGDHHALENLPSAATQARSVLARMPDGFADEPRAVPKQLTSNGLFHTPGFFRAMQNDYRIEGKTRRRAIKILSDGYGLPREEAEGLLSGAIAIEIDEVAGTITYALATRL